MSKGFLLGLDQAVRLCDHSSWCDFLRLPVQEGQLTPSWAALRGAASVASLPNLP